MDQTSKRIDHEDVYRYKIKNGNLYLG